MPEMEHTKSSFACDSQTIGVFLKMTSRANKSGLCEVYRYTLVTKLGVLSHLCCVGHGVVN